MVFKVLPIVSQYFVPSFCQRRDTAPEEGFIFETIHESNHVQSGHVSSIGIRDNHKRQSRKNTVRGIRLPNYFPVFVLSGVVADVFFLECSFNSHQLCSIENPSNPFGWATLNTLHRVDLSNIQHEFSWICPILWFRLLRVILVDEWFITSDYTMQNNNVLLVRS